MADTEDESPPLEIDPYSVLEIRTSATTAEVKSAYKKLALRHHPDKVAHHERPEAHSKFQEIAFAYAILSDDRRRKRYDTTGNTAETLDIEDDDFNWLDFFRAQWADTVTSEKISEFAGKYKGSDEERQDLLKAFRRFKGDMNKLFRDVMLCNVLDDEDRFATILNGAIANGEVEGYDAYVNEPEKKKQARRRQAEKDAKEAEKHARDLGLNGHKKEKKKKKGPTGEDELAAMIQQRQKGRAANFLDDLQAKYAAPKVGKGKKRPSDEPPEEAFRKMDARAKKQKKAVIEEEDEDDTDDVDLRVEIFEDDEDNDNDDEEDNKDQDLEPSKARKKHKPNVTKKNGTRKKG